MQTPLQITFRGMGPSETIESYVRARADKLERFYDRITGCHVIVDTPHRHLSHGRHHVVRIDLIVPGAEIVVTRDPTLRKDNEDVYASIDAAFDDAQRRLEDYVRKERGDVKPRETPSRHARVAKIFPQQGYGFLETPDGQQIYFHANSVLHGGFARLEVGTRVRFVEEAGEEGPQASTVAIGG